MSNVYLIGMRVVRITPQRLLALLATLVFTLSAVSDAPGQLDEAEPTLMPLGKAWAANSINTAVFRNDPITTHDQQQYAAYYDADGRVVLATRHLDETEWKLKTTDLRGNINDAHNGISLGTDQEGYLHIAWDHHNNPLNYVRSREPGTLELTEKLPMTGKNEARVTYPQFYRLSDGGLMFVYRDGASGRGNLVVNRYNAASQEWKQLHGNLISGENERNAYWQASVGPDGAIHISWVWRESGDVATNHDLLYARSDDGGKTWKRSDGSEYDLPITAETAEMAAEIPQKHELINQTSICTDGEGRPIIATYFRPPGEAVVQYFVIHHDGSEWQRTQASDRKTPFSLSGGGSKQIPISRPQVFASTDDEGTTSVWLIYRDVDDSDGRVLLSQCDDLAKSGGPEWETRPLTDFSVTYWEPAYDRVRWQRDGVLDLFVQNSGQGDGEALQDVPPQRAYVLELKPGK